jgi:hypothetical protein
MNLGCVSVAARLAATIRATQYLLSEPLPFIRLSELRIVRGLLLGFRKASGFKPLCTLPHCPLIGGYKIGSPRWIFCAVGMLGMWKRVAASAAAIQTLQPDLAGRRHTQLRSVAAGAKIAAVKKKLLRSLPRGQREIARPRMNEPKSVPRCGGLLVQFVLHGD